MTRRSRAEGWKAGYYSRQRWAIYQLQMREAIIRMTVEGKTDAEIAKALGQSQTTIRRYREKTRQQSILDAQNPDLKVWLAPEMPKDPAKRARFPRRAPPIPPRRRVEDVNVGRLDCFVSPPPPPDEPPDEPHLPDEPPPPDEPPDEPPEDADPEQDPGTSVVVARQSARRPDEVLDPADIRELRAQCLDMRKAMLTFPEIAKVLGISEKDARAHTAYALKALQDSETSHADLERRLMVEQIDDMIRAIRPHAVGDDDKDPVLDAVDRMIKLMDRKAKLLGLDQAESVDVMVKLQHIASEANYDLVELQEIARDVFARHRMPMPLHLVADTTDTSDAG